MNSKISKISQNKTTRKSFLVVLFLCLIFSIKSNADSISVPIDSTKLKFGLKPKYIFEFAPHPDKTRIAVISIGGGLAYGSSLVVLNQYWYANYARSKFHFFNDNNEFYGMDKVGHWYTSYNEGTFGINMLRWAGMKNKTSIWLGGCLGILLQTPIEIMDGYSSEWGFSPGDMAANISGSVFCIGQELLWNEQRLIPKISSHRTQFAKYRPDLLGKTPSENFIKDYNGQTYWLSVPIKDFFLKKSSFPNWLCISGGYGIDGFTGAVDNPLFNKKTGAPIPFFNQRRQFYLSVDISLARIKTKNKTLKTLLKMADFIKIPAPTIEFNSNGVMKGYFLYF